MTEYIGRIQALELELAETISYLRRLPLVPETARVIRHAEGILSSVLPPVALVGACTTPAGFIPLKVESLGHVVTVSSNVPEWEATNLWRYLKDGVTVSLTRNTGSFIPICV